MADQIKGDDADWATATWEENRLLQQRAFRALSFRQKVAVLEEMGRVTRVLQSSLRLTSPREDY
jgi:hypothetical protein